MQICLSLDHALRAGSNLFIFTPGSHAAWNIVDISARSVKEMNEKEMEKQLHFCVTLWDVCLGSEGVGLEGPHRVAWGL